MEICTKSTELRSPISESWDLKVILKLVAFKFKLALSQRNYALNLLSYCSPISESWNFKVILKLVAFKFTLALSQWKYALNLLSYAHL